jgi:hypothetical protein
MPLLLHLSVVKIRVVVQPIGGGGGTIGEWVYEVYNHLGLVVLEK